MRCFPQFVLSHRLSFPLVAAEISRHLPLCSLGHLADLPQGAHQSYAVSLAIDIVRLLCDWQAEVRRDIRVAAEDGGESGRGAGEPLAGASAKQAPKRIAPAADA